MATPTEIRNVVYNSDNPTQDNRCATDSAGNVWIAFRDPSGPSRPSLVKYDNAGNVLVAAFNVDGPSCDSVALKVDSNDRPVIAWQDSATLKIARFTSGGAADIGPVSFGTTIATYQGLRGIDMCLDSNDDAFIAFRQSAGFNQIATVKFTMTGPTFGAQNVVSIVNSPDSPRIDSNSSDLIVVCWGEGNAPNDFKAAKIDNTNATIISATQISTDNAVNFNDVEVAEDGRIYFFYSDAPGNSPLNSISKTAPAGAFVADTAETSRDAGAATHIVLTSDSSSNIHLYYKQSTGNPGYYSVYEPSFASTIVNKAQINSGAENIADNDICVSAQDEVFFVYADANNTSFGTFEQWNTGFTAGFLPRVITY